MVTVDIISLASALLLVNASNPLAAIGSSSKLATAPLNFYNLARHPTSNLLLTTGDSSSLLVAILGVSTFIVTTRTSKHLVVIFFKHL